MTRDPLRTDKDIRRCEEALHAADTLLEEHLFAESISRSYYAVIHAVMLLLTHSGREIRHPEEAERIFSPEIVQDPNLGKEMHALFNDVRQAKKDSPYNYLYKYSREDAASILSKSRAFLDLVRRYLGVADGS